MPVCVACGKHLDSDKDFYAEKLFTQFNGVPIRKAYCSSECWEKEESDGR